MAAGSLHRQFVTVSPKPKKTATCDIAEVTVVTKFLTSERVTEMDFDKWNPDTQEGIAQRDTRVGKTARIQNDEIGAFGGRQLHAIDQLVLGIALKAGQSMAELVRERDAARFDVRQLHASVDLWLPRAKQVEIWAIE